MRATRASPLRAVSPSCRLAVSNRRHPCRKGVNGVVAVQRPELEIICSRLARLQDDQLTRFTGGEASRGAVRARLDADDVRALSQHPPDEMPRQLVAAEDLVGAEPCRAIGDG